MKNFSFPTTTSTTIISFRKLSFDLIPIGILWAHTIILNLLIAISIIVKCEKTYLNIIYLSITISDLLTGLVCITFEIFFERVDTWFVNVLLCIIDRYTEYSSVCIALYSLLLLTIHRYYRLVKPSEEKESMTRARYFYIGSIWIGSILFWVMLYLVLNDFALDARVCNITLDFYLVLALNFVLQIVPLATLIFFNFVLLKHIWSNLEKYNGLKIKYLINSKKSRYPKKLKKGKSSIVVLSISMFL